LPCVRPWLVCLLGVFVAAPVCDAGVAPCGGADGCAAPVCGVGLEPSDPPGPNGPVGPTLNAAPPQGRFWLLPPSGPDEPKGPSGPVGPKFGTPEGRPWFTPQDSPGSGLALVGLGVGAGAADANASGPPPRIAQVVAAILVRRFADGFIVTPCVSLRDRAGTSGELVHRPPPVIG
jgi:hypothetical protein